MLIVLHLNVIGDRSYAYDVSSDFPKEIDSKPYASHRTLRISKADHIKYLTRAKLAGTAVGFGQYIRATENINAWAMAEMFKPNKIKGVFVDESDDTADATAITILNQLTQSKHQYKETNIHSTTAGPHSINTSGFYRIPRPKPESVKKITWHLP